MRANKGKLITTMGIPCSGKSAVARELGKLINAKTLHEPEESAWGDAVRKRDQSGNFTAMMWFRSIRVPLLCDADKLRKNGGIRVRSEFFSLK